MRDIKKAIFEYEQIFRRGSGNTAHFYESDVAQVREIGGGDPDALIMAALKAGYAIGYRRGRNMSRQTRNS